MATTVINIPPLQLLQMDVLYRDTKKMLNLRNLMGIG